MKTFTIQLNDDDARRFAAGLAHPNNIFDSIESLVAIAAETGLVSLERIEFDVAGAVARGARSQIHGKKNITIETTAADRAAINRVVEAIENEGAYSDADWRVAHQALCDLCGRELRAELAAA